ncbi:hypothetical protein [Klebsiella sp. GB_Kp059]|uniref:hypothetical protein n=1 Tax=Klebsiella sp. GB_Kp059 TaxID=3153407 RepID=UPI0032B60459
MLESLKEFTTSTFNTAMNRVKNPAFGAFAISWCAFNWKQILYLFFADNGIYYKIEYISQNSNWWNVIVFPALSSLILCFALPWINNPITKLQSKPLDNADSIDNFKQARMIQRATRLQRLKAKHDVTYEKVKTGDEKNIQKMKEEITESQSRMGEITKERDELSLHLSQEKAKLNHALGENSAYQERYKSLENELNKANDENRELESLLDYNMQFTLGSSTVPDAVKAHLIEVHNRAIELGLIGTRKNKK